MKKAEKVSTLTSLTKTKILKHKAFTLIEILLVLAVIGLMAGISIPKLSFYFEPPAAVLQRAIEEATDKALSGIPVRLSIKSEGISRRGYIFAEALVKREVEENSLSAFLGSSTNRATILEWQPQKFRNMPDNSGWRFEPEIIYFYSDGSCTPAKITWENPERTLTGSALTDEYILTVTGYVLMRNEE